MHKPFISEGIFSAEQQCRIQPPPARDIEVCPFVTSYSMYPTVLDECICRGDVGRQAADSSVDSDVQQGNVLRMSDAKK